MSVQYPGNKRKSPMMTGRQNGKGRKRAVGKGKSSHPQEKMKLLQLLICGTAFLLLVAVKLLLPAKMEQFNSKIEDVLHQNMDVRAVFSAVSQAAAGGDIREQLAQAVFGPQETDKTDQKAQLVKSEDLTPEDAKNAVELFRLCLEVPNQNMQNEEIISTLAQVQYSQQNLPENVRMGQEILDFSYSSPLRGVISSRFGYREHPVEGEERFHYGVDLAADKGTDICCFADGEVRAVGESSSYGKYCIIDHGSGFETLYAHCDRITVSSGTTLHMGEKLGEVGETGIATGPHLHFELHKDGIYLDPVYYVSVP